MQGRELFDLIRRIAPAKPLYVELMHEVERADALEEADRVERQAELSRYVSTIGVFAGTFVLLMEAAQLLLDDSPWWWQSVAVVSAGLSAALVALRLWRNTEPPWERGHGLGMSTRRLLREVCDYFAPRR